MALVGMGTTELAADTGIDSDTLDKILTGLARPSPETMDRIRIALEAQKIEFGERSGVCLKDEYFRRLTGEDSYLNLLNEVLRTMLGRTDDVLFFMVEHSMWDSEELGAEQRLWDAGIKCRYISPDASRTYRGPAGNFHYVPRIYPTTQLQVIYSEYVAIVGANYESEGIIILNSESAANAERSKFDFIWQHSESLK